MLPGLPVKTFCWGPAGLWSGTLSDCQILADVFSCARPEEVIDSIVILMFLKEVSSAHQGFVYLIKNSNVVKHFYNLK